MLELVQQICVKKFVLLSMTGERDLQDAPPSRVRRDLRDLKEVDIQNLKAAMASFQRDKGGNGWEVRMKCLSLTECEDL